jgi:hypothetical protein
VESGSGRQRSSPPAGVGRLVVVGGYCVLLLLGLLEGLIGSFQYSRALGSFPAAALAFAVGIGATCVLGAWGMFRPLGGLMPAVGWFVASFVLSMSTPGGSVVITNTGAGKWFLFGGSICAVAAVVFSFLRWPRRPGVAGPRRTGRGGLPPGGHAPPLPGARKPDP